MFRDRKIFQGFSVDDIDKARAFYGETLGLDVRDGPMGLLELHLAGREWPAIIYPKPDHTPASFTILNIPVDDVEAAVDALTEKGVAFEKVEGMPQDDKGIMRGHGPDIAWFTDPAGNVISVIRPE